jgi:hypothetical protein
MLTDERRLSNLLFITGIRHRRTPQLAKTITAIAKDLERRLGVGLKPATRRRLVGEVVSFVNGIRAELHVASHQTQRPITLPSLAFA